MPIHFNPYHSERPHSLPPSSTVPSLHPHQHRGQGASTLTVPNKSTSCFDKLKQWLTSFSSWIKNLFGPKSPSRDKNRVPHVSKIPAGAANPVLQPQIGSSSVSPRSSRISGQSSTSFAKNNLNPNRSHTGTRWNISMPLYRPQPQNQQEADVINGIEARTTREIQSSDTRYQSAVDHTNQILDRTHQALRRAGIDPNEPDDDDSF